MGIERIGCFDRVMKTRKLLVRIRLQETVETQRTAELAGMRRITRQKIQKTVYLDKSQLTALRKLARRRGVSVSALGREAINIVIRKFRNRIREEERRNDARR